MCGFPQVSSLHITACITGIHSVPYCSSRWGADGEAGKGGDSDASGVAVHEGMGGD